jgi:hypothetical protein
VGRLALSLVAALFLLFPGRFLCAQNAAPTHAPDFRAQQKLAPLYFPPKPNAPFMALAKTTWMQTLPDGSTVTRQNERVVARDMDGRIFQERRTFVPVPSDGKEQSLAYLNEYSDPVAHTIYSCYPGSKFCNLENYFDPMNQPVLPAGPQPDGISFLTRENMGVDTFEGLEVQRTRETFTIFKDKIGNTKTILRVVDYWYSPALGINVKVVRHDPRDGDQTLWLTKISTTAADPAAFQAPAGYRIFDRRTPKPLSSPPATAP